MDFIGLLVSRYDMTRDIESFKINTARPGSNTSVSTPEACLPGATAARSNGCDGEILPGVWVEVRSAQEIATTLDSAGTLGGLPFMPEMVEYCGRRFRVLRQAEKTCVEGVGPEFLIREVRSKDVVLLDGLRCSGTSHDGCQRLCLLFWKVAWLRVISSETPAPTPDVKSMERLSSSLRTKDGPDRYFCQSTQLLRAVVTHPMAKFRILQICFREVRSGSVSFFEMIKLICVPLYRKTRDVLIGRPRLVGRCKRTPVGTLNLQPGELVIIKSLKEIQETLDARGRNRGLVADIELGRFCGQQYRVRGRLDRMISESTGEMRKVEGTVILEGNTCLCARALGGCPRLEYCYWREVWLRRVGEDDGIRR